MHVPVLMEYDLRYFRLCDFLFFLERNSSLTSPRSSFNPVCVFRQPKFSSRTKMVIRVEEQYCKSRPCRTQETRILTQNIFKFSPYREPLLNSLWYSWSEFGRMSSCISLFFSQHWYRQGRFMCFPFFSRSTRDALKFCHDPWACVLQCLTDNDGI